MDHRTGVGTLVGTDDVGPRAVGPELELVAGRGAKGVARRQDDRTTGLGLVPRQFSDGRRLADAVHPHEEPDRHAPLIGAGAHRPVAAQRVQQRRADRLGHALGSAVGAQLLEQRASGGDADVRAQEHLFDHVELLLGEGTGAGDRAHAVEDRARGREAPVQSGAVVDLGAWSHLRDEHVGHRLSFGGDHDPRAPPRAHHQRERHHDHQGQDDPEDNHADTSSGDFLTRCETTFDEAPGTMVTP